MIKMYVYVLSLEIFSQILRRKIENERNVK